MKSEKQIANQKYIRLFIFYVFFTIINGSVFTALINANSDGGYGPMIFILYALAFDALIAIGHGYITFAKLHSFFVPQLFFYVSVIISFSSMFFFLIEDFYDFVSIFIFAAIFLLFSCFGALIAKIVMVFKKRFSQSKSNDV